MRFTTRQSPQKIRTEYCDFASSKYIPPFLYRRYFDSIDILRISMHRLWGSIGLRCFFPASLHRPLSHTYVCLLIEFYVTEPYLWYRRGDNAQSRRPSATWPCRVQLLQSFTHLARSFSSRVNFVKSCFPVAAYTILNNN